MSTDKITRANTDAWLKLLWNALHCYREDAIPEGNPDYDAEWGDICTVMAWIEEDLA